MSKFFLIAALFVSAALASSEIQDQQWWLQYFLSDISTTPYTKTTSVAYVGKYVQAWAGNTGNIANNCSRSGNFYKCPDKQDILESRIGEKTCYVWVYPELGCSGEPLYAWGFVKDVIYKVPTSKTYTSTAFGQSLNYYFDTLSSRYVNVGSYLELQVQEADGMMAFEICDAVTNCADASRPNVPLGCTDLRYSPGFPFLSHNPNTLESNNMHSALVICNEDTGCPRSCLGKACGVYDDCGEPCIGTCDDGYYCKHSGNAYSCEKSQYGLLKYQTLINYDPVTTSTADPAVTGLPSYLQFSTSAKRNPPSFYLTPTITHIENAFKGDIYWATNKMVPADAIIFDEIKFFTEDIHEIEITYHINVDVVNTFLKSTYTAAQLSQYISSRFTVANKKYQYFMSGPFTSGFDMRYYQNTSIWGGQAVSQVTTTQSEWVKSVVIKDSWVAHTPDPEDSAATIVAWMALVVPLLALLL